MNFHKLSYFDTANGQGIGTVVWVSGCAHHCPGCHNPQTWDKDSGKLFTDSDLEEIVVSLTNPHVKRLTLSGGDPLYPANIPCCTRIVQTVKKVFPEKKIWLYTGYTWENIELLPIVQYVDVLVDGEFQKDKKDINLDFCGSTNQRVIDVQQSLKNGHVVLWRA